MHDEFRAAAIPPHVEVTVCGKSSKEVSRDRLVQWLDAENPVHEDRIMAEVGSKLPTILPTIIGLDVSSSIKGRIEFEGTYGESQRSRYLLTFELEPAIIIEMFGETIIEGPQKQKFAQGTLRAEIVPLIKSLKHEKISWWDQSH